VVRCLPGEIEFLKDGKVVATGNHETLEICDKQGACRPY
jgi:hypothetical protein